MAILEHLHGSDINSISEVAYFTFRSFVSVNQHFLTETPMLENYHLDFLGVFENGTDLLMQTPC